jgi:hypothetical protein
MTEPGWWTTPPLSKPRRHRMWACRITLLLIVAVFVLGWWKG